MSVVVKASEHPILLSGLKTRYSFFLCQRGHNTRVRWLGLITGAQLVFPDSTLIRPYLSLTDFGVPDRFLIPYEAFSVLHPPPVIVAQLAPKSVV